MKDLAGNPACDLVIAGELERSGIEVLPCETGLFGVPSQLFGRLGPIEFWRASLYWVAHGPLPLAVALDLYEDPLARRTLYVHGHGEGPPPQAPWVAWYTSDGARIRSTEQEAWYRRERARRPGAFGNAAIVFHDDPKSLGASPFIDLYHIDSEIGLQLFADAIRRHGLAQASRPPGWDNHHNHHQATTS
jgi:hypothetical protein